MNLARLAANWHQVNAMITTAARAAGRDPASIRMVAVTKKNPPAWVRALVDLGARDLGENYPQELWGKAEALADQPEIRWHLIGHLQGNKLKKTLPLIRFAHAVDSLKLLRAMDDGAAANPGPPLDVCLQVNTSGEASKHGWSLDDQGGLEAALTSPTPHVRIVGLMTIAGYGTSPETARPLFAQLRRYRDQLIARTGVHLPELSMGMSGDFEAAIAEGATLVRVGSALFDGVSDD